MPNFRSRVISPNSGTKEPLLSSCRRQRRGFTSKGINVVDETELCPCLLVGLGNPGKDYEMTRHNIGFQVIDRIIAKSRVVDAQPQLEANSHVWRFRSRGRDVILQKPLTYMNLSGDAVAKLCHVRNIAPAEVVVIFDDVDLPLGRIRLRKKGGSAGHNGLQSIISSLGSEDFNRLRVGVGRCNEDNGMIDYVLSSFSDNELPILGKIVDLSSDAAIMTVKRGVSYSMNQYNGLFVNE